MVKKVVLDDSASESESQHLSDGDDFDSAPQALSKSAKAQAKHD